MHPQDLLSQAILLHSNTTDRTKQIADLLHEGGGGALRFS